MQEDGNRCVLESLNTHRSRIRTPYVPLTGSHWLTSCALVVLPYLAAITIIGKGPTYLGIFPVFWAEAVLAISVLSVLMAGGWSVVFLREWRSLSSLVVAFMGLGLIHLQDDVRVFGLDAIRDSSLWYYSAFYFVGLVVGYDAQVGESVWRWVSRFWVMALIWGSCEFLSGERLSQMGPEVPLRGVPVLSHSGSDLMQNMSMGMIVVFGLRYPVSNRLARVVCLIAGIICLIALVTFHGRGAKLAVVSGVLMGCLFLVSPRGAPAISRRLGTLLLTTVVMLTLGFLIAPEDVLRASHVDRLYEISLDEPLGTTRWRVDWWVELVNAVAADNAAFGLGFGESLSIYSPYLTQDEYSSWPVRSPHNYSMAVFARMGVVGLFLWLCILLIGLSGLIKDVWRGEASPRREQSSLWIIMLLITVVNGSFGVLMDGPVLGIWFWFALGFATVRSRMNGTPNACPSVA